MNDGLEKFRDKEDYYVFHSGTKFNGQGQIVTNGGRVLGVTANGATVKEARENAYKAVKEISFANKYYRTSPGRWTRRRNIGKTTDSREKLADRGFLFSAVKKQCAVTGVKNGKTSCKFFIFHYIVRINKGFGRDFVIYYKYTENSAFLSGCRIRHPTLTILPLSMFWHIGSSCLPLLCWHIITLQSF